MLEYLPIAERTVNMFVLLGLAGRVGLRLGPPDLFSIGAGGH